MAINISDLNDRIENEGITEQGKLSAAQFNRLVSAVIENQGSVKAVKYGSLDPISPDADGLVTIPMISDTWSDVLRLERQIEVNYEKQYESIVDGYSYLYKDTNIPIRLRFQEYRNKVDAETGEASYEASNQEVTIRIYRETSTGKTQIGSDIKYTARGFGNTDWYNIDLQGYLSAGYNTMIVEVTGSRTGEPTSMRFTMVAAGLTLSASEDTGWQNTVLMLAQTQEERASQQIVPAYHVGGAVYRTLVVEFENSNGVKVPYHRTGVGAEIPESSSIEMMIDANEVQDLFMEGVHTVRAWVECSIAGNKEGDPDQVISTEDTPLVNHIIMAEEGSQNTYMAIQSPIITMLNYESATLLKYVIYSPAEESDVQFFLSDMYATENYMTINAGSVRTGALQTLSSTVSIPTSQDSLRVYVYATINGQWANGSGSPVRLADFLIDNSEDFGAVEGADFYLNPLLRSNAEKEPATVINTVNNKAIEGTTFSNVSFKDGVDGWIEENNVKMLRLLAGSEVVIPYDVSSDYSLTIEIDMAVRNITNEEDPVLTIGNRDANNPKGLYLKALTGSWLSKSNSSWNSMEVAWQEGVRTHLVFNFQHNYVLNTPEQGRGVLSTARIAIMRAYINGVINKEWRVTASDLQDEMNIYGNIVIGQAGTDIDIYGIRVYKKNLTAEDVVKNKISTLHSVAEKKKMYDANDIMKGGVISLEKALEKGYDCIVWHGKHLSKRYSNNPKRVGYARLYQHTNGELDRALSGRLYGIEASGQGTTAMTYADWNFSFKEDKKTGVGHDEYKYNDGGTLRSVFVDMDGNVGYGKTKFGYMLEQGDPVAKKLVGKINYASSMQSHKIGACNLYNDLYRELVPNTITDFSKGQRVTVKEKPFLYFVQEEEGGDDALAVFKGLCTFGPGKADKPTWGVTDQSLMDGDSLIEGALNNNPLTDQRVPFVDTIDSKTGRYVNEYQLVNDQGSKTEAFVYAGAKNLNWGFGDTLELHSTNDVVWAGVREGDKTEADAPTTKQVKMWQPIWNFGYLTNTRIKPWTGTLRELNNACQDVGFDVGTAYWMTTTVTGEYSRFDLYRCHYSADGSRVYVPAGLVLKQGNKTYKNMNVLYDLKGTGDGVEDYTADDLWYDVTDSSGDTRDVVFNLQVELNKMIQRHGYDAINYNDDPNLVNIAMRKTLCKIYRAYVDNNIYYNRESLLLHHETMVLWAGTDNRSKNTYYRLNPYNVVTVNGEEKHWPNMEMDDDDLDTILPTNNSGIQSKPYYVLEDDLDESDASGYHWEGQKNVLNNTLQDAYGYGYLETAQDNMRLPNMMGSILKQMQAFANGKTMPDGTAVDPTPMGCFDYYFFYVTKYFPAVAYNETARIRYEVPAVLFQSTGADDGGEDYPQDPIAQQIGDQYDRERDFVRRRITMLAGYAGYRMNQWEFRGYKGNYKMTLKPHQYIYPMYEVGDQKSSEPVRSMKRVATGGEYIMQFTNTEATNSVYIYFIGNMREIGNIASWSDGTYSGEASDSDMSPNAARLVKFEMWSSETEGVVFNPKSGAFNFSSAQNLEEINVRNAYRLKGLNGLSGLVRLQKIDARGTMMKTLSLPETPALTEVRLPSGFEEIRIGACGNLALLTVDNMSNMKSVVITGTTKVDTKTLMQNCMTASSQLSTVILRGIQWTGVTNTLLNYLVAIPRITLTGTIEMAQGSTGIINFALKKKIIERFGNVDSESNGLRITYMPYVLNSVTVSGDGYFAEVGEVKHYDIVPITSSENTITGYRWSIDEAHEEWAKVDSLGNVTCLKMSEEHAGTGEEGILTATVEAYDATGKAFQATATMTIRFYTRSAKVGDYVYHDGTYDDRLHRSKDVVGICFYVNPTDPTDRRMVALDDRLSYQWGLYPAGAEMTADGFPSIGDNALLYDTDGDGTPDTAPFDIPDTLLPNTTKGGYVVQQTYTDPENGVEYQAGALRNRVRYETMIDPNTGDFVDYAANTAMGRGLGTLVALGEEIKDALFPRDNSITADTMVPQGFRDTCGAIIHRNRVLTGTKWTVDDVTTEAIIFKPNDTTVDNLAQRITEIRQYAQNTLGATYPDIYSQYLYSAASAAFAYEPTVTGDHELIDKFKHNHWYLPSEGEQCRLAFYHLVGREGSAYKKANVDDIFYNAVVAQKFTRFTGSSYWSSTEFSPTSTWYVGFHTSLISEGGRFYNLRIRPVCQF